MPLDRIIIVAIIVLSMSKANGQIAGFVYDVETNKPISGAHIVGTKTRTTTNIKGEFKIDTSDLQLTITHVGYKPDSILIKDLNTALKFYLIPETQKLNEIKINSSLNNYPYKKVPASIGVFDPQKNSIQNDITYLSELNNIPGVFVQSGTNNTNRITVRGIGSRTPYGTNRIKAYYNNIPLSNGDGTTEIEDIDIANISQITIVKGPKSGLYGSGLGGIMLIENSGKLNDGPHAHAEVNMASYNTIMPKANIAYQKNTFSLQASYA